VAPLRLAVPADIVLIVDAPLTVVVPPEILADVVCPRLAAETVPPEIALFNAPVTETVPPEIPLVMVALLPKLVDPAPESVVTVTVPVPPLKFTVPALVNVPTLWPAVPEIVAEPVPVVVKSLPDLKLTAVKVAPSLTVIPEVPPKDPAEAVSVPAEIVVVPE
jgi:hypothetical protein